MALGLGRISVGGRAWPSWEDGLRDLQRAASCSALDLAILKRICPEMFIPFSTTGRRCGRHDPVISRSARDRDEARSCRNRRQL